VTAYTTHYETMFVEVDIKGNTPRDMPTLEVLSLRGFHTVGVINAVKKGMADMTDPCQPIVTLIMERVVQERIS
jgi:hypothetical protein